MCGKRFFCDIFPMNLIAHTSSWFGLSDSQQKEEAKKRGGAGKYRREKRSFPPAAAAMFFVVGLIPAGASKIECKLLPFPESYALASTSSSSSTYSLQHATSSTSYLCVQPPLQTLKLATTHIRSTPLVAQSFYFEKIESRSWKLGMNVRGYFLFPFP